jgi:hypothetical protein
MEASSVSISKGYIHQIAQSLDCGMICFVNPNTYELEDVPHDFLCGMYHDATWQEVVNRIDRWEKYIAIDRPGHTESVEIMRSFVERYIPKGGLKEELDNVLSLHRPDTNFHRIVGKSDYHHKWVAHNRRHMMKHIRRKLRDHISQEASLPCVAVG